MQNIDSFLEDITRKKELLSFQNREIKWLKKQIMEELQLLTKEIDKIFAKIKEYNNPIEANSDFDKLDKIQCLI